MSKIQQMIDASLPIVESESDEAKNQYVFNKIMTFEQHETFLKIIGVNIQDKLVFGLPLRAPSITVGDIFVESRAIKDDPEEALAEAILTKLKQEMELESND